MSLPILVAQENWQAFDDAWIALMNGEEALDELLPALLVAGEKKRIARCVPLVRQHAELLELAERNADGAALLGTALTAGAPQAEFAAKLTELALAAWGEELWWEEAVELTGLTAPGNDPRQSWKAFGRLRALDTGAVVYHAGGWGTGEVTATGEGQVTVRFHTGMQDRFPLSAALDIFEVLPESDLRALHFRDSAALKKRIKKEPLEVLRAILERYHGRVSLISVKNALAQVGLEGSGWSAWWRRVKKLAEDSEWFRLAGSGQRMELRLLLEAADPCEQLQRQLKALTTLEQVLERCRSVLNGRQEPALIELALEALEAGAAEEDEPLAWRMAAWLAIRSARGETPEALAERLALISADTGSGDAAPGDTAPGDAAPGDAAPGDAAPGDAAPGDAGAPHPAWRAMAALPTLRDQEAALDLLPEVFGEDWLLRAGRQLRYAPPGMLRPLVERLLADDQQALLGALYVELLSRPQRAPHLLVTLARLAEDDRLEGDYPPAPRRAQSLVSLAARLWKERRENPHSARSLGRLVEFLTAGRDSRLEAMLADAEPETLRSIQLQVQQGIDESIDNIITSVIFHSDLNVSDARDRGFWEGDEVWTTRGGMERFNAELRELRDEKIPANEDAIGAAAALGDLSENAEWEMALQEKRNLTTRLASMEADALRARLLEDASLPADQVCPGTAVSYRDLDSSEENRIVILGPWDTDLNEEIVSYRAPLAQGLLGLSTGDQCRVDLPGGSHDLEVLAIEVVDVQ
ncbi:MAG: hypothetical protein CMJ84_08065 [Planctomycetes bacterium]|nr:hypothetical protein [Planctomycetota bacterium]